MIRVTNPKPKSVLVLGHLGRERIAPGATVELHNAFHSSAAKKGLIVEQIDPPSTGSIDDTVEMNTSELKAGVEDAVKLLVDEGDPKNFTTQGKLRLEAVNALTGGECTRAEVDELFDKLTNDVG